MLSEITIIVLSSIIAVPVVWYIGYRMLNHLGYQIVKKENQES